MRSQRLIIFIAPLLLFAWSMVGCGSPESARGALNEAHIEFFNNLAALKGRRFEGRAVYMIEPGPPFEGARLNMHVESASEDEIRIPFHVGDDHSRTWVLSLHDRGLLFKHDHRHADGTPEDLTDYGGWATDAGTSHRQHFPADTFTAALLPEAATNVWTMEIRPDGGLFIYDLSRHARPRFRAEIDLGNPVSVRE